MVSKKIKGFIIGGVLTGTLMASGGAYAYQNVGYSLSVEKAKEIVYKSAGVSASDVEYTSIKKDREGVSATYDIEFYTASGEYDYTIDASTGSVLERDMDTTNSPASAYSTSSSTSTSTGQVSKDQAKEIALSHAALDESSVSYLTIQLDTENGEEVYDIEFQSPSSNIEYDYTIQVTTGDILEQSTDSIDND